MSETDAQKAVEALEAIKEKLMPIIEEIVEAAKKIIKVVKKRPVFDYKIVTMLNGKQNGHIGQYRTYAEAREVLVHLEEVNNNVIFPRKYLNKGNITLLKDEYLLLEKNRFGDKDDGVSRNEFGKFVQQKIL